MKPVEAEADSSNNVLKRTNDCREIQEDEDKDFKSSSTKIAKRSVTVVDDDDCIALSD